MEGFSYINNSGNQRCERLPERTWLSALTGLILMSGNTISTAKPTPEMRIIPRLSHDYATLRAQGGFRFGGILDL